MFLGFLNLYFVLDIGVLSDRQCWCLNRRTEAVSALWTFPLVYCFLFLTFASVVKLCAYFFKFPLLLQKEGSSIISDGNQIGHSNTFLTNTGDVSGGGEDRSSNESARLSTTGEQLQRHLHWKKKGKQISNSLYSPSFLKCPILGHFHKGPFNAPTL